MLTQWALATAGIVIVEHVAHASLQLGLITDLTSALERFRLCGHRDGQESGDEKEQNELRLEGC